MAGMMSMPGDQPTICPVVIGRAGADCGAAVARGGGRERAGGRWADQRRCGNRQVATGGRGATVCHRAGLAGLGGGLLEADRAYPYAPLLDLFRTHLAWSAISPDAGALDQLVSELARWPPDLAPLFPHGPSADVPQALDPDQQKQRLFTVLTRFFAAQAARRPVLLVVEDVHWCDESSLELAVLHLARRCATLPILCLFTYRSEEVSPGLRHWLAQLDRGAAGAGARTDAPRTVGSRSDAGEGCCAAYRGWQSRGDGLDALAEGNPFFVEELLGVADRVRGVPAG